MLAASIAPAHAGPGAELYNEMVEKGQLYDNEAVQQYIEAVGERILAVSPDAGQPYTFAVQDSPVVNAFATGDAYIFITRGIMAHFKSEDELAAVIGHEIGHVVGRHHARRKTTQGVGNVLGWIGLIGTSTGSVKGLADTITATLSASYGRKYELESDAYGIEWLSKAGYDPNAMIQTIQLLRDNDLFSKNVQGRPTVYHGIFGSHPEHQKRLHDLYKISKNLPQLEELSDPVGDFWSMIDGLTYGDETVTGLVKNGSYYHGGLRLVITFPKDWNVGNNASEVIAQAPSGNDAYITVQRQQPPSTEQTPETYVSETLKRDDVVDGEPFEVGPYSGYKGNIEIAGGGAQKRKIAVIFKDGAVYLFKGEVGQNGNATDFDKQWEETLASFRSMTKEDLKVANSQQLKVIEARPGDTYAKLAKNVPVKRFAEETLRVINGHHPNGEPRAGDFIKVVQ